MSDKSLLLISARPEDHAFAAAVAMSAGLSLRTASDARTGAKIIAEDGAAVILCDVSTDAHYQALEKAIQDAVGLFSDRINSNAIYFLSSQPLEKVQYLIQSPLFGHFVIRNYGDVQDTGTHFGRVVRATLADRAFGLKRLLKDGAKTQALKLQVTTQKQDAVEAVKNYLLAAKFQSRMATVIANAVDELLMNAMFDAPTDELGRPLFTSTARSASIKLENRHAVEMHVGYDGQYIAITAIDLFGSLDKLRLLTHISKVYADEEYKVKTTVANAGLGLATVFRSGGSFFFVSEARVRTEVTVFFKRTASFREFKDQFKFLSTQFYF
jgi:hypothetical protein